LEEIGEIVENGKHFGVFNVLMILGKNDLL